jgi:hypothetical protein
MLLLIIIVIGSFCFLGEGLGLISRCRLRFRISEVGVVGPQEDDGGEGLQGQEWDVKRFGGTQDFLPGIKHNDLMDEVTYLRFVNAGDKLLLTWRIGQ